MIQGNIALYKPTEHYGMYGSSYSSYAVDGRNVTNYEQCAHPSQGADPWWRVDLGRVEDVAEVHILNRGFLAGRFDGAEIRVGQ